MGFFDWCSRILPATDNWRGRCLRCRRGGRFKNVGTDGPERRQTGLTQPDRVEMPRFAGRGKSGVMEWWRVRVEGERSGVGCQLHATPSLQYSTLGFENPQIVEKDVLTRVGYPPERRFALTWSLSVVAIVFHLEGSIWFDFQTLPRISQRISANFCDLEYDRHPAP